MFILIRSQTSRKGTLRWRGRQIPSSLYRWRFGLSGWERLESVMKGRGSAPCRLLPRGVKLGLRQAELLRCLVARAGAKPCPEYVRAGEAVDRREMGRLQTPLSARDARPRNPPPDHDAGGVISTGEFFHLLLLRNLGAMSSFVAGRPAARAGQEVRRPFR